MHWRAAGGRSLVSLCVVVAGLVVGVHAADAEPATSGLQMMPSSAAWSTYVAVSCSSGSQCAAVGYGTNWMDCESYAVTNHDGAWGEQQQIGTL